MISQPIGRKPLGQAQSAAAMPAARQRCGHLRVKSRLVTHGFTTHASGHGFGLHSGALGARDLGGALLVKSDGPGCGAMFILELPCNPEEPVLA